MARRLRCLESVQERRNPARTAPCERVRDLHSPCLQLRRQPYPYRLGLPRCWRRAAPSGLRRCALVTATASTALVSTAPRAQRVPSAAESHSATGCAQRIRVLTVLHCNTTGKLSAAGRGHTSDTESRAYSSSASSAAMLPDVPSASPSELADGEAELSSGSCGGSPSSQRNTCSHGSRSDGCCSAVVSKENRAHRAATSAPGLATAKGNAVMGSTVRAN